MAVSSKPKEGVEAFLDEQSRGGGVVTQNRPDAATNGIGNPLPEAQFYRITAPARDRASGQPNYSGVTLEIAFIDGRAWTPDRDLAYRFRWDFGYQVEVETDVSHVKLVPVAGPKSATV